MVESGSKVIHDLVGFVTKLHDLFELLLEALSSRFHPFRNRNRLSILFHLTLSQYTHTPSILVIFRTRTISDVNLYNFFLSRQLIQNQGGLREHVIRGCFYHDLGAFLAVEVAPWA
jgi:hypothetical protein